MTFKKFRPIVKKRRKSFSLLIPAIILALFILAQTGKTQTGATLTAGTASGNPGTSVTIPITLSGVPALTVSIVSFDLTYDPTKLSFPATSDRIEKLSAAGGDSVWVIVGESTPPGTISITLVEMNDPTLFGFISSGQIMRVKFNILSPPLPEFLASYL